MLRLNSARSHAPDCVKPLHASSNLSTNELWSWQDQVLNRSPERGRRSPIEFSLSLGLGMRSLSADGRRVFRDRAELERESRNLLVPRFVEADVVEIALSKFRLGVSCVILWIAFPHRLRSHPAVLCDVEHHTIGPFVLLFKEAGLCRFRAALAILRPRLL